jgi:hypothetical protein
MVDGRGVELKEITFVMHTVLQTYNPQREQASHTMLEG